MTGKPGCMPDLVSPMTPSAGSGQPPSGPDWVVELGWTGHRCIAHVEPGRRIRLLSTRGVSMSAAYPELWRPLQRHSPPRGMVLDGTLVARGEEHAPRARLLHRRSARTEPTAQHIRAVPVDFQVADLLWLDGHPTVDLPYRDRRALLDGLGFTGDTVWTTSPMPVSELAGMLEIADAKGVDALHARHLGSRYHPGGRSPLWVKVPVPRIRDVVVGGWTATDPAHPDTIASLLLGVPDPERAGGLRYVGRVGMPGDHRQRLADLRRWRADHTPFADGVPAEAARHAIWVAPRLVDSVEFTGFTADGRLRLPRWLGPVGSPGVRRWATSTEPPSRRDDPPTTEPTAPSASLRPTVLLPPVVEPLPVPPRASTVRAPSPPIQSPPILSPSVLSPATLSPATLSSAAAVQGRRLEQHFVYNSLNTIASLIRTDPARARELLVGFADLSRAADQPGDTTTLGRELDAVRGYLQLEQARFGARLRVEIDVDAALHGVPVEPLRVLGIVRRAVQDGIEPRAEGGLLTVTASPAGGGATLTVTTPDATPTLIPLHT